MPGCRLCEMPLRLLGFQDSVEEHNPALMPGFDGRFTIDSAFSSVRQNSAYANRLCPVFVCHKETLPRNIKG